MVNSPPSALLAAGAVVAAAAAAAVGLAAAVGAPAAVGAVVGAGSVAVLLHAPLSPSPNAPTPRSRKIQRRVTVVGCTGSFTGSTSHAPFSTTLFDRTARNALDKIVEEKVVENGDGHPGQECPGHQRPPEVHIAANQVGDDAERHRLFGRARHERRGIDVFLHREREREDRDREYSGNAER